MPSVLGAALDGGVPSFGVDPVGNALQFEPYLSLDNNDEVGRIAFVEKACVIIVRGDAACLVRGTLTINHFTSVGG
jgi:hypothetical protein